MRTGENFSNGVAIRSVFDCLAMRWDPICRRAYGSGLANHRSLFRDLGISPIEVFHNTTGKNAADIALVIDVMTELSLGRSEAFCIVSGDGDFSRLALTVRERGFPVLVFGPESTPDSLRAACTEFHLLPSKVEQNMAQSGERNQTTRAVVELERTTIKKDPAELAHLVLELAARTGKTTLRAISQEGYRRDARFCSIQYGNRKLTTVLQGLGLFDVRPVRTSSGAIRDYEVRLRIAGVCPADQADVSSLSGIPPIPSEARGRFNH